MEAEPTVAATPAAASSEDGAGNGWVVVALLPPALALFGAGLALGRRRWRERAVEPPVAAPPVAAPPVAAPPEPRRFDWRTYPPPARPAPPPPGSAPRFAPGAGAADSPIAVADSPRPATAEATGSPWTREAWRAEVVWDEAFKVRVLAPGRVAPRSGGGGPECEPALVASLEDLQAALEAEGWTPVGRAGPWYGRRFVWQRPDPPPGQGGPT